MEQSQDPVFPECNRHHAISILLANDPDLLNFLFSWCRRELAFGTAARTLRVAGRYFDRHQILLVRIALAIWEEKGRVSFVDAYKGLNDSRFETFLRALERLYGTEGCQCADCIQRHLAWSNEHRVTNDFF